MLATITLIQLKAVDIKKSLFYYFFYTGNFISGRFGTPQNY